MDMSVLLDVLRHAVHDIFTGEGSLAERVDRVAQAAGQSPMVDQIIAFIRAGKRPLMLMRQRGGHNLDA